MHVHWHGGKHVLASRASRLEPGDVHLWQVGLAVRTPVMRRLHQRLDPEERARANRFLFAEDRARFIAAHGALRDILSAYLGRSPERVAYRYARWGKPYLTLAAGDHPLQFNLTHSGALALIAVTRQRALGVDVECIRPHRHVAGIAAHFFSSGEVAALQDLPPDSQTEAFYACWTRKEAYIKARGEGLSAPLHTFDVSLTPDGPAALLRSALGIAEVQRWSIVGLAPAPGYVGALVVEGHGWHLACWTLDVQ